MSHEVAPRWIGRMFAASSIVNFIIGGPPMIAPRKTARLFADREPNPLFPMQAWAGMAFMFGFMFREIARDPVGKRALVRYAWAEKLVSAVATSVGYRAGDASRSTMVLISAADWAMIAPFMLAERRLTQIARSQGTPRRAAADAAPRAAAGASHGPAGRARDR